MSPTCAYAHRDTKERTAKVSEYRVCKQLLMLCFSSVFRDCFKSQLTLCTAVPWVGLSLRFYVAGYMQVLAVELNQIELLLLFFLFSHERSRGVMLLVALGKSPPPGSFVTAPTWVCVVDGVASWTIGNYWFAITWQGGYIGGHTINFGRIYMKGSSVPLREI